MVLFGQEIKQCPFHRKVFRLGAQNLLGLHFPFDLQAHKFWGRAEKYILRIYWGIVLFKSILMIYICIDSEGWVSGLNQQFAKLSYA